MRCVADRVDAKVPEDIVKTGPMKALRFDGDALFKRGLDFGRDLEERRRRLGLVLRRVEESVALECRVSARTHSVRGLCVN